jgi:hypothetical protein
VVLDDDGIADGKWRERVRALVEMSGTKSAGAQGLLLKLYDRFLPLGCECAAVGRKAISDGPIKN